MLQSTCLPARSRMRRLLHRYVAGALSSALRSRRRARWQRTGIILTRPEVLAARLMAFRKTVRQSWRCGLPAGWAQLRLNLGCGKAQELLAHMLAKRFIGVVVP